MYIFSTRLSPKLVFSKIPTQFVDSTHFNEFERSSNRLSPKSAVAAQWSERGKKCTKPQKIENRRKKWKFDKRKLQLIKGSIFMLGTVAISSDIRLWRSFRCGQIIFIFRKPSFLTCYRALKSYKQICALIEQTSVQ